MRTTDALACIGFNQNRALDRLKAEPDDGLNGSLGGIRQTARPSFTVRGSGAAISGPADGFSDDICRCTSDGIEPHDRTGFPDVPIEQKNG